MGIHLHNVTPYWPRANGEIERFFRTLKKTIQSSHVENRKWQQDLFDFLLIYRSTPHCSTNQSPSALLMNRNIRNKLPSLEEFLLSSEPPKKANGIDSKSKDNQTRYNKHFTTKMTIQIGDIVLMKQLKRNKLTTNFGTDPLKVVRIHGSQITAERQKDNKLFTRNSSFFKKLIKSENLLRNSPLSNDIDYSDVSTPVNQTIENGNHCDLQNTRQQSDNVILEDIEHSANVLLPPVNHTRSNTTNNTQNSVQQTGNIVLRGNPTRSCGPPDRLRY